MYSCIVEVYISVQATATACGWVGRWKTLLGGAEQLIVKHLIQMLRSTSPVRTQNETVLQRE